jgi:hypothetical protein
MMNLPCDTSTIIDYGYYTGRKAIYSKAGCFVLNPEGWFEIDCGEFYKPGGSDELMSFADEMTFSQFERSNL